MGIWDQKELFLSDFLLVVVAVGISRERGRTRKTLRKRRTKKKKEKKKKEKKQLETKKSKCERGIKEWKEG